MPQVSPLSAQNKFGTLSPPPVCPPDLTPTPPFDRQSTLPAGSSPGECEPAEGVASGKSATDPLIGAQLGNFRVVRKLCEGGMGIVYEAQHSTIGRRAVVKVMRSKYAQSSSCAARFLNEARAVNLIGHPGLVEIFDYGQLPDGTPFIVMEFLQGESLQELLEKRTQPFAEKEALGLAIQLARVLTVAHGKGIVHRDLKPDNIMLVPDPITLAQRWTKLIDFGIAKIDDGNRSAVNYVGRRTLSGTIMGTPMYMAPEQFGQAKTVDGRADVFSLGVILYQLLAGRVPHQGTWSSLLKTPAPGLSTLAPTVSPELAALVHRMIAIAAAERPTMEEVLHQLAVLQPSVDVRVPVFRLKRMAQLLAFMGVGMLVSLAILGLLRLPSALRGGTQESKQRVPNALIAKAPDPQVSASVSAVRAPLIASPSTPAPARTPELVHTPTPTPDLVSPSATKSVPVTPALPKVALGSMGAIRFVGEKAVRVRIGNGPWLAVSERPVWVPVGFHLIRYAGGSKSVLVSAHHVMPVVIPVTYAQQLQREHAVGQLPRSGAPDLRRLPGVYRARP